MRLFDEFGKGKTVGLIRDKGKRNAFINKWLPIVFLVIGLGLVAVGILIEIGVL